MVPAEYMVCLATFGAIQACGVEEGMAAGLVLAALSFTITYAQASKAVFMLCFGRLRFCFSVSPIPPYASRYLPFLIFVCFQ